ncbi:UNVERIFIED_ORG: hypothetical protein J2X79_002448 [Arthrobacter globiformis]|nr:hypothetical protein [Arthrobacter globiformis]
MDRPTMRSSPSTARATFWATLDQHTTHAAPVRDNLNELYRNA